MRTQGRMQSTTVPRWQRILGLVITVLQALTLVMGGVMKLSHQPELMQGLGAAGFTPSAISALGVVELVCAVLYLIPQTAVLGVVLITGYLGGATAVHVQVGEPVITPVIIGAVFWLGLWLRDPRLRALLPLRLK